MNILFTSSGRRNYLLKYFKKEVGNKGKIIAADMDLSAVSLAMADVAYKVPRVYSEEYISVILDICNKEAVDIVVSLNDLELPILSANKEKFEENGTVVVISDKEVIDICFDKEVTNEFISKLGYKTPITFTSLNEAKQALERGGLSFPIIIKPRWGSGSLVMEIVETIEELEVAYKLIDIKLNKTVLNEISKSDRSNAILIQELLDGEEYGLDVINDLNGNYQTTIVKNKLNMRAGETDKAKVVERVDISELGEKIAKE
ncbi:MAG: ATP-grasp domain-containing protein, partial [Salinivirgaceae bacterium]|nr:ATP-grasp domain-containing protein [Salinivirgaceae bacterium]